MCNTENFYAHKITPYHTTDTQNRKLTSILNDRTSFRAKGLQPNVANRNFTPVFDVRTSFRAKKLQQR